MATRDPLTDPEPLVRRVYAYVAYRMGDGWDAEDVTATTFERAIRYRADYDQRRGEPIAWLIGIARRSISDHYAQQRPTVADVPELAAPGELDADAASRLDLRRAVSALGERDRELVALRYGADLTAKQIGVVVALETNAVEVALHRALASLREALEPKPEPEPEPSE